MHLHVFLPQLLTNPTVAGGATIAAVMATRRHADLARSWREMATVHARVHCALDRALQAEHALSPSEFDVLERLATEASGSGCRMQELADAVNLSQSALSRLVGRLETEGLVERCICSADRRGIYAAITDAGRARYEQARPTQLRVLAEQLDKS